MKGRAPLPFDVLFCLPMKKRNATLHHIDFTSNFSWNWEYVHFIFLSAARRRFGGPAAIAQVFRGDVYEHESMHLYFFCVSHWSSTTLKKREKRKGRKKKSRVQIGFLSKAEGRRCNPKDWGCMKSQGHRERSRWSRGAFPRSPISVLLPVWFCRYSCISSLVFFFVPLLFFFFFFSNLADFVVFIPLRCNVLLCRIEACTLSEKIKKDFICLYLFYFTFVWSHSYLSKMFEY